jgi:hypothetical protein
VKLPDIATENIRRHEFGDLFTLGLTTFLVAWIVIWRLMGLLVNNEWGKMWTKAIVASFEVLCRDFLSQGVQTVSLSQDSKFMGSDLNPRTSVEPFCFRYVYCLTTMFHRTGNRLAFGRSLLRISVRTQIVLTEVILGYPQSRQAKYWHNSSGYKHFLPNPFQFIIHQYSYNKKLYSLAER